MTFDEILGYITNNGFAIVMCIYMMRNNNQTMQKVAEIATENTRVLKENTKVLSNLEVLIKSLFEKGA